MKISNLQARQITSRLDPKFHMVAACHSRTIGYSLFPELAEDAPEGQKLLKILENCGSDGAKVIMD
ncbi:hypothetical protein [uncultured Microbulbifer sp.]|uniref:hypothetical protein n=1 Tax=uncultured Microbulbifer sp. TaxID=348147 RepID=UPI00263785B8|nr:hypothetical protein [uncultured Microbulbifer sp.]